MKKSTSFCRLCMGTDDNLMKVFEINNLDEVIYQCVQIKIQSSDTVSTNVCFDCMSQVQNWLKFKNTCDYTQKELFKNLPQIIENLNICETSLTFFDKDPLRLKPIEHNIIVLPSPPPINSSFHVHSTPISQLNDIDLDRTDISLLSDKTSNKILLDKHNISNNSQDTTSLYNQNTSIHTQNSSPHNSCLSDLNISVNIQDTSFNVQNEEISKKLTNAIINRSKIPLFVKSIDRCYEKYQKSEKKNNIDYKLRYEQYQKKSYECKLCKKQFSKFREILYHDQHKHPIRLKTKGVQCHQCSQVFLNKKRIEVHISLKHSEKLFTCDICNKNYVSQNSLRLHKNQHSDKYKCNECPKTFSSAFLLKNHEIRSHIKIKSFNCSYCIKSFFTNSELKRHTRMVHKNNLNYFKCEICDYIVKTKQILEEHIELKHSNEILHICEICGEKFKTKSRLNYHSKMHDTNVSIFECPICSTYTRSRYGCKLHISLHRKEKQQFICDFCGEMFRSKNLVRKHLKKLHSNIFKIKKQCFKCNMNFIRKHKCKKEKQNILYKKSLMQAPAPAPFDTSEKLDRGH